MTSECTQTPPGEPEWLWNLFHQPPQENPWVALTYATLILGGVGVLLWLLWRRHG